MAEIKTKPTEIPVKKFIDSIPENEKREDSKAIMEMMRQATKLEPRMWGASIIGFGSVHYKYESGREGDICKIGFSPRKQNIALYLPGGHSAYAEELSTLGKHKTGKGCLYINKLSQVDLSVLAKILAKAAASPA